MNQIAYIPEQASHADRLRQIRRRLMRIRSSSYDVSSVCNLTCEGCLYFSRADGSAAEPQRPAADWDRLFAAEAARGINFAYLNGAEPSMAIDTLRCATRHFAAGVIFSNGTRRIPDDIRYRIHLSMWGLGDTNAALRGADVNRKALSNYAGDPRAVFVLTVSAQNIDQIVDAAALCNDHGVPLTFSYFSATEAYNRKQADNAPPDPYFRQAQAGQDPRLDDATRARARHEIGRAMQAYPDTVVYDLLYDAWIAGPSRAPFDLDPDGIAINCAERMVPFFRYYLADGRQSDAKCSSPNIDCSDCRAYAMGWGSYLKRHTKPSGDPMAQDRLLRGLETWAALFLMPEQDVASG